MITNPVLARVLARSSINASTHTQLDRDRDERLVVNGEGFSSARRCGGRVTTTTTDDEERWDVYMCMYTRASSPFDGGGWTTTTRGRRGTDARVRVTRGVGWFSSRVNFLTFRACDDRVRRRPGVCVRWMRGRGMDGKTDRGRAVCSRLAP